MHAASADRTEPASPRLLARIAGVAYLVIIVGGLYAPFAIAPSGMMMGAAVVPTAAKIVASPALYALGGVSQLIVYTGDIVVAIMLYQLLKSVNGTVALLATAFRLVFAAVAGANIMNHFAALALLSTPALAQSLGREQLQALVLAFGGLRTFGFDVALLFFGIHNLLLGYLLYCSGFFPRIFGIGLAIAGVGYVANIFAPAIPPAVRGHLFPYVMYPAGVAEIAFMLWLIIAGIIVSKWPARGTMPRQQGTPSSSAISPDR